MNETDQKKEREEKKEKNPVMKLLVDGIVRPVDKLFGNVLRIVEDMNLTNQIQYPFYLSQESFWYNVTRAIYNFDISGFENIPPEGQAAVVCMNHQSMFDPVMYNISVVHHTKRRVHVMGKEEAFEIPFVGTYVKWCYAFPVKRGEHDMAAWQKALDFLNQGELVGMYPEGTINGGEYNFLEPHVGAARLAIEGQVPIIPIGMSGPDRIFPRGTKFPNLNSKLISRIGEPITVHEKYFGKEPSQDQLKEVMAHVMDRIKQLLAYKE